MPPDIRDEVVDFIKRWNAATSIPIKTLLGWLPLAKGKYHDWQDRYGKANEHNGLVPRDFWLENWEKEKILDFHLQHPLDGYRRLSFMMLDGNVVAVSPSSVYRVLKNAGVLDRRNIKPSKKGMGYVQPLTAHQEWHVDISYLNLGGTFYYLATLLDGYSRYIVHWEIKEKMQERDIELLIQRAREKFPGVTPRIISDNGPQFVARDFKDFIRLCGMTHVRTSPFYPQSNGKLERWHKEIKTYAIRPAAPRNLGEAIKVTHEYVDEYNNHRLHSAIGYVAPKDKLDGRESEIFTSRDRKLEEAREVRKLKRADPSGLQDHDSIAFIHQGLASAMAYSKQGKMVSDSCLQ